MANSLLVAVDASEGVSDRFVEIFTLANVFGPEFVQVVVTHTDKLNKTTSVNSFVKAIKTIANKTLGNKKVKVYNGWAKDGLYPVLLCKKMLHFLGNKKDLHFNNFNEHHNFVVTDRLERTSEDTLIAYGYLRGGFSFLTKFYTSTKTGFAEVVATEVLEDPLPLSKFRNTSKDLAFAPELLPCDFVRSGEKVFFADVAEYKEKEDFSSVFKTLEKKKTVVDAPHICKQKKETPEDEISEYESEEEAELLPKSESDSLSYTHSIRSLSKKAAHGVRKIAANSLIGSYVAITLKVKKEVPLDECLLLGSVFQQENKEVFLNCTCAPNSLTNCVQPSLSEVLLSTGFETVSAKAVFYNDKLELTEHSSKTFVFNASFFSKLARPLTPIVSFVEKYSVENNLNGLKSRIIFAGNVRGFSEEPPEVYRKEKLVGVVQSSQLATAFVKGLFSTAKEAFRQEGETLRTEAGVRGLIKKAMRDGLVRCTFEDKVLVGEKVVFVKKNFIIAEKSFQVLDQNQVANKTVKLVDGMQVIKTLKKQNTPENIKKRKKAIEKLNEKRKAEKEIRLSKEVLQNVPVQYLETVEVEKRGYEGPNISKLLKD